MMKKKLISAAVLVGIAGSAGAVNVNPDGLGQALLYSYYTVRGGNDTLVSITNTTDQVKAVKVRFLEGKNTREVLDFNLYLSPADMWTGAIVATEDGAKLVSGDTSCTVPAIPADGVDFRSFAYTGANDDGEAQDLDRTREGHIEVLEMGVVGNDGASFTPDSWATHAAGVPNDCASIRAAWAPGGAWTVAPIGSNSVTSATGGIYGGAYIISVENGTDVSYNATALDGWRDSLFAAAIHTDPGNLLPNLNSAFPFVSNVFNNGTVVTDGWTSGIDAVSAVLMHDTVMNDYILDEALDAGTDWVITFPTKNFYVNGIVPLPPFTTTFGEGGAPEIIGIKLWDREETTTIGDVDFSPLPPGGFNSLPWESNVLTLNNSDVLASVNSENVPTDFANGWMRVSFTNAANRIVSTSGTVYSGLPTTGFSVINMKNGDVGGVLSNYGNLFDHRSTRNIAPGSVGSAL